MNTGALMPALLLLLLASALSIGGAMVMLVIGCFRRNRLSRHPAAEAHDSFLTPRSARSRNQSWWPNCWLAIKTSNVAAVQCALGLRDPQPCSWEQGLEEKLFIAPPVKGWILVTGSGLPDPSQDVDACFRFVLQLSRKLGQTQFFSANPILHHHAWVRASDGRVGRAYAWAGRTLWLQGPRTAAEQELGMLCFDYGDSDEGTLFAGSDAITANVEKVPLLAARWGLDPESLDVQVLEREGGIAGEPGGQID
jgi:hypothetical protein